MAKKTKLRLKNGRLLGLAGIVVLIGAIVFSNVLFTMITKKHIHSQVNVNEFKQYDSTQTKRLQGYRGTIFDRNGEVIGQDEDTYTIILYLKDHTALKTIEKQVFNEETKKYETKKVTEEVDDYVKDIDMVSKKISKYINMEQQDIYNILLEAKKRNAYQTELGLAGKNLSATTKDAILELNLDGIDFMKSLKRTYTNGNFSSNLIGFAQYDDEKGITTGRLGLEQTLEDYLAGENGEMQYQKDVSGLVLPGTTITNKEAVNGKDVYLTLDQNVQLALQSSLQKTMNETNARRAWGLVVEVETGKILGWASTPTFDLNKGNVTEFINVPCDYQYEPGSVMKAITYAAAIDSGVYPYNKEYQSGTFYYGQDDKGKVYRSETPVKGFPAIRDALNKDYGIIDFDKGFVYSSNIAICELLTNYLDPNVYLSYIKKFNFLQPVDIPFVSNQPGSISFEQAIDRLSTGFGQAVGVTALQMVQAYSAILNDGKMVVPYVVDRIVDSTSKEVVSQFETKQIGTPIKKETADYVQKLMRRVVSDEDGTGHDRYEMKDVSLLAKTGTGQIINDRNVYGDIYTNSVMAAAPADDPKVMVYYVFESSEFLKYSGDPFKETMKAALVACNIGKEEVTFDNEEGSKIKEWREYTMPNFMNHTNSYVENKLKELDTKPIIIGNGTSVIGQYPPANTKVSSKQNIFLYTDGTIIKMPDMKQWTKKDLRVFQLLTNVKIEIKGNGCVVSQNIKKNTTINKDTIIKVKLE